MYHPCFWGGGVGATHLVVAPVFPLQNAGPESTKWVAWKLSLLNLGPGEASSLQNECRKGVKTEVEFCFKLVFEGCF